MKTKMLKWKEMRKYKNLWLLFLMVFILLDFNSAKAQYIISIVSPNGGEIWQVGLSYQIAWNTSPILYKTKKQRITDINYVRIDYSTDNGSSWINIIDSTQNTDSYIWTIPNTPSTNCLVRVSTASGPYIYGESSGVFTINPIPNITVTSPNGGETWVAGTVHNITWTDNYQQYAAYIEYSTNGGNSWNYITQLVSEGPLITSYSWTVPYTPSSNCLVRVSDLNDSTLYDQSNSVFTISSPTITITSPNGGENWYAGTTHNITWTNNYQQYGARIEYSTNGGNSWNLITQVVSETANITSYSWTVPNTPSSNCLVSVSDLYDSTVYAESNNVFTISPIPVITVTSPNGGENWTAGTKQYVKWTSSYVNYVNIQFSTDYGNNWENIASNISAGSDSYLWTIPNTPSKTCLVNISDASNSDIYDLSNSVFTINSKPYITVTSPNGGEDWLAGSSHNITWESNGVDSFNIDYSINNGTSWIKIAQSISKDSSYSWTVPNTPSIYCKVRITDVSDTSIVDQSDSVFTISAPSITVTSPNGGENWLVGTSHNITWNSENIANVNIDLSTDNGKTWLGVVQSIKNNGLYNWTVPNTPSTNCRVRVSDASNSSLNDESDSVFTISTPSISVTSPNGGENWQVGSSHNITWNSTDIVNVKIELSTNNGDTWIGVAQSVPSSGTYKWTIPNLPSTNCRIKISDVANDSISDQSNNIFTINPILVQTLSVTSPNGGENWFVGTSHNITWSSTNIANVRLDYSTDNGETWLNIIQSTPSSGSYSWLIPNTPSTACKVRISDTSNASISSQSDSIFTIKTPTILVTSPNGGENWYVGSSHNITWTSTGITNVKIDYSTNNGETWTNIVQSTSNNGSFNWIIPKAPSVNCKVRVSDASNVSFNDQSDNVFTISASSISVTSPNGGENWSVGSSHNITWTSTGISNVKIDYSTDNGETWINIISTTPSDGTYNWVVPNTVSSNCRVRISDVSNSSVTDQSNGTFTISQQLPPTLTVTSPNGGEDWQVGTMHNITWTSNSVTNINIDYSTNNGESWINIIQSTPSDGSYNWTVPNTPSTNCRVRITDSFNPSLTDQSTNVFTISLQSQPTITVTSPNGGENWQVGSTHNITWTNNGVSTVNIDYTTDNGENWLNIVQSTPSDGSYSWTIPNTPSINCRVRITDSFDSSLNDQSDNVFTISSTSKPTITVTSPNGGENWSVGSTHNITWTSTDVSNVNIDYTTNNGENWINIIQSTPSDGSYNWDVPNTPSTNCRVRITDSFDSSLSDQSDNIFTISSQSQPIITVTSPNGGENWSVGSTHNITWTSSGVSTVNLDYTTNSGENWINIVQSTSSDGSYNWTVPNTPSSNCRVRITDSFDSSLSDQSDNVFTISSQSQPIITVTSPNGGENWSVGSTHNITWTSSGVSTVNLDYTTDNGDSWISIIQSAQSNGSYSWNIPNTTSTNCRVLVTDVSDHSIYDQSDNTFTISLPVQPIANFSAAPVRGLKPLTVNFSDSSANQVTNLQWNFGDGTFSTDKNPVHTYNYVGTYTVELTATGPGGSNSITKQNLITVDSLVWNAPSNVNAGDSVSISTTLPSYFNPTSYQLFYRLGGQISYQEENFQPNNNSIFAEIPSTYISVRGVEFYTKISNGKETYTFPETDPVNHPAVINVKIQTISPAITFQSVKYEMISIPLKLENQNLINFLIDAYGAYNKNNWRLLRWNSDSASYDEYPDLNTQLNPGMAFWLITRNGNSFKLSNVQSSNTSKPIVITLESGWNQIGNPFAFPVVWDSIGNSNLVQAPILWNSTDQQYESKQINFFPWIGYWVYNPSAEPVTLSVPPVESIKVLKGNSFSDLNNDKFLLQIKAFNQNGDQDDQNFVGMLNNTESDLNKFNVLEPPPITEKLNLSIINDGQKYIENYVNFSSEGAFWDLNIHSNLSDKFVKVEFDQITSLPQDFKIWLLDKDKMLSIPVVNNEVNLQLPQSGTGNYRLIVGNEDFAKNNSEHIPLTAPKYSLQQNYPNPFNPTTNIIYNLHEKSRVSLVIFDILGREVKVLVNDEFQDPGMHNIVWDGTNSRSNRVSSGVYIYRIEANNFTASKMMVLLK